ncbi:hypothetical protein FRX31_009884, partial [Thalictrum thalictroides]
MNHSSVADMGMIAAGGHEWNLQLRRRVYDWELPHLNALMEKLRFVSFEDGDDMWSWKWHKSGSFTVKSMFKNFTESPSQVNISFCKKVWKIEALLKV